MVGVAVVVMVMARGQRLAPPALLRLSLLLFQRRPSANRRLW